MAATEVATWTELVHRITAFGLADGEPIQVPEMDWLRLLAQLDGQRLTGLAVAGAESGWLELTEEQGEQLLERHRMAMMQALALERWLLRVSVAFQAAAIESVVLKGPALAHTVYPNPAWRPFVDLDLLVRGREWRRACEVLAGLGFRRDLPEPRRGFDERFGKAAAHTGPDGLSLDLHRTLVVGPFGLWMDPEELFERTSTLRLAGRDLRRLDDTAVMAHAGMHAALGWWPPLLLPLRDVAQVAWKGNVDWDALAGLARHWRLTAVLQLAVESARTIGLGMPPEAARVLEGTSRRVERRALKAYTTDRWVGGGTAVATLQAIPGLRAKLSYARHLLFPDREFLVARAGGRRPTYARRLRIPLRWARAAVFRRRRA
jgi:hypothetical protein